MTRISRPAARGPWERSYDSFQPAPTNSKQTLVHRDVLTGPGWARSGPVQAQNEYTAQCSNCDAAEITSATRFSVRDVMQETLTRLAPSTFCHGWRSRFPNGRRSPFLVNRCLRASSARRPTTASAWTVAVGSKSHEFSGRPPSKVSDDSTRHYYHSMPSAVILYGSVAGRPCARSATTASSTMREVVLMDIATHRQSTAALTARRTSSSVVASVAPMRTLSGRPTIRRYVMDAGSRWSEDSDEGATELRYLPTLGRARPIAARRSFLRGDAKRSATSQDECLLAQRGAAPVLGGLSVWVRGPV